jgi:hypothetical protein
MSSEPGARIKSWPVSETDGSIMVFFGENSDGVQLIGGGAQYERGLMLPDITKERESLGSKVRESTRAVA